MPLQLSLAAVAFCVWPWWSSAWFNLGPLRNWLNGRAACEFCGFEMPCRADAAAAEPAGTEPCAVLPLRRPVEAEARKRPQR